MTEKQAIQQARRQLLGLREQITAQITNFDALLAAMAGEGSAAGDEGTAPSVKRGPSDLAILHAVRGLGDDASPGLVAARLQVTPVSLRPRLTALVERGWVALTGQTVGRRIQVLPAAPGSLPAGAGADGELEPVWRPHRDAPSLTGTAPGLGSTLGGHDYGVRVRR